VPAGCSPKMYEGDSPSFDSYGSDAKRKKTRNASSPSAILDDDYDAIFTASDEDFSPKVKKRDKIRKPPPRTKTRRA